VVDLAGRDEERASAVEVKSDDRKGMNIEL
jgi:hypothetical protein